MGKKDTGIKDIPEQEYPAPGVDYLKIFFKKNA